MFNKSTTAYLGVNLADERKYLELEHPNLPGENWGLLDVQNGKLWDTYKHPGNAACSYKFFMDVAGASNKTWAESNMSQPGRLPSPSQFAVKSLNFMFSAASPETELLVADEALCSLYINQKWFVQSTMNMMRIGSQCELDVLRQCGYCTSVHILANCPNCGSAKFMVFRWDAEQPETSHMVKRTVYTHETMAPLHLSYQTDFMVEIRGPYMAEPFTLKCWLDGLHGRGVS